MLSWEGSGCEGSGWEGHELDQSGDETAYYDGLAAQLFDETGYGEEGEPSPEEAATLKQESEAVALAAEANRTLSEARPPLLRSGLPGILSFRRQGPGSQRQGREHHALFDLRPAWSLLS